MYVLSSVKAMSSIIGLTTPEVIGLGCCKIKSVSENSENYIKLCKFVNLPRLRDVAIQSAQRLIKQWAEYEPGLFVQSRSLKNKRITRVKAKKGTLLYDIFELSRQPMEQWYPEFEVAKQNKAIQYLGHELLPDWQRLLTDCEVETVTIYKQLSKPESTILDRLNTYWMLCKWKFGVLETISRVKRKLPIKKIAIKRDHQGIPGNQNPSPILATSLQDGAGSVTSSKSYKREALFYSAIEEKSISCKKTPPRRGGKKAKTVCRICGYSIAKMELARSKPLECCDKIVHHQCWFAQATTLSMRCENIKYLLKRDRRTRLKNSKSSKPDDIEVKKVRCLLCEEALYLESDINKDHLVRECSAVNGPVVKRGY